VLYLYFGQISNHLNDLKLTNLLNKLSLAIQFSKNNFFPSELPTFAGNG
jgi:hypothetical protein